MKKIKKKSTDIFRENLRSALDSRDITITKLAEMTEDSRTSLSAILNGLEGVGMDRAQKLAVALDFSLPELLSEDFAEKVLQTA